MQNIFLMFLIFAAGLVNAQNLPKAVVLNQYSKSVTINTDKSLYCSAAVLDSGSTADTLNIYAVFSNPNYEVLLGTVDQSTRKRNTNIIPGGDNGQTYNFYTGGAERLKFKLSTGSTQAMYISVRSATSDLTPRGDTISIGNFPSNIDWTKARWDSLYAMLGTLNKQNGIDSNFVTNFPTAYEWPRARWDSLYAILNTLNKQNGIDSNFVTNFPTAYEWPKARWDSLYAILNTLDKQNGIDTVFNINTKDTISFIDTLKNGDSLRTRTVVGYKFVTAYMQSSAATDSVEVSCYDVRQNKYGLVAVYDQYLDAKYQLMIPGANIFRGYLINSPNVRVVRYRRTNLINLTNLTIITTVCIRN